MEEKQESTTQEQQELTVDTLAENVNSVLQEQEDRLRKLEDVVAFLLEHTHSPNGAVHGPYPRA